MFENPGGKVKGLALGAFILESLSAFITGIVLWEDIEGLALLVILGGVLVAYVTSILFYAFGEMVEATAQTRDLLLKAGEWNEKIPKARPAAQQPEKPVPVAVPTPNSVKPAMVQPKTVVAEAKPVDENMIACSACGTVQRKNRTVCFQCRAKLTKEG